jgi:hypothetical protein
MDGQHGGTASRAVGRAPAKPTPLHLANTAFFCGCLLHSMYGWQALVCLCFTLHCFRCHFAEGG